MLKLAPLLGTVALVGVIVQVILGLEITGADLDTLTMPHALIGVLGFVLIVVLAITAFRAKTSTLYSKLIITILTVLVLLQVSLGWQLLQGSDAMIMSHEANGFLILILTLAMGAVTMQNARKRP